MCSTIPRHTSERVEKVEETKGCAVLRICCGFFSSNPLYSDPFDFSPRSHGKAVRFSTCPPPRSLPVLSSEREGSVGL